MGPGQREGAQALAFKMYFVSGYAVPVIDARQTPVGAAWAQEACKAANLILIGPPAENNWTAHFRCAFPYVEFLAAPGLPVGGFALGGNAYTAEHTGVLALGGLPTGRLAMLVHAIGKEGLARVASAVPVTSGKDDADFVVFGPDYGWQGMGGILASGFLDASWRIASGWREPEHAVAGLSVRHSLHAAAEESSCGGYLVDRLADRPEAEGKLAKGAATAFERFIYEVWKSARYSQRERERVKALIESHSKGKGLDIMEALWIVREYGDAREEDAWRREGAAAEAAGLSSAQVAQFRHAFVQADVDGSNTLSDDEILSVFHEVMVLTGVQVGLLKREFNSLGESKAYIDFPEFLRLMGVILAEQRNGHAEF